MTLSSTWSWPHTSSNRVSMSSGKNVSTPPRVAKKNDQPELEADPEDQEHHDLDELGACVDGPLEEVGTARKIVVSKIRARMIAPMTIATATWPRATVGSGSTG